MSQHIHDMRRKAANEIYENAELGEVVDASGWESAGCEWMRPVFVAGQSPDADSVKQILRIMFEEGSADVIEATFAGEDVEMSMRDTPSL